MQKQAQEAEETGQDNPAKQSLFPREITLLD